MQRFDSTHLLLPLLACLTQATSADLFDPVWGLGSDDGELPPFSQESFGPNSAPGSPTSLDDDYYFSGTFTGIGTLTADEPIANFEHAVSQSDPRNRVHFALTEAQSSPNSRLRITVDLSHGGAWTGQTVPGFSTHHVEISMNGVQLAGLTDLTWNHTVTVVIPATSVNASTAENTLLIERTGGGSGGYIGIDFLKLEADSDGLLDSDHDGMPLWFEETYGLSDQDDNDATIDSDGDGLSALVEFQTGTNPTDLDSDNDGLSDSAEIAAGTLPLIFDTDGDGLSDGDEISSNPLLADSDSDGYPDNIELEQGSDPTSPISKPFDFPGAISLQFVTESLGIAEIPEGEPAGYFRLPHWNAAVLLPQWQASGAVLNGSKAALVDHRGDATTAAASWSYHHSGTGFHKGPGNERLFSSMIRSEHSASVSTPATVSISDIPYPTYDVLVYVGFTWPGPKGTVERSGNSGSLRYFTSASAPPFLGFTEITSTSSSDYQAGNYVRYRNLSGSTQSVSVIGEEGTPVCIHGIQIIDIATDSDGDGMSDSLEVEYGFDPAVSDANADPDNDGMTNAAELAASCDPHHPDTDRDGILDGDEASYGTSPTNPDSDDDTLLDGDELTGVPFPSLPDESDSDGDFYPDAVEVKFGSDPMLAASIPPSIPFWDAAGNRWVWRIDDIRILWNHDQSMLGAISGDETMLCEAIAQVNQGGWDKQIGMGIRYVGGHLTYRFRCIEGLFYRINQRGEVEGLWNSDWSSPPLDRSADLGFSGYGPADESKPLRLEFVATRAEDGSNSWTLDFLMADISNPSAPVPIGSYTWTDVIADETSLMSGDANWTNAEGVAGAFDVAIETGVRVTISPVPIGVVDSDSDGMPDAWEIAQSFDESNAADASLDADNDDLSNLREYLAGTDPHDPDSDNDDVLDGAEFYQGTDPLSSASKPAWFNFSGNLADLDGDGLSDAWSLWSGGKPRIALADDDGDGMSNLAESEAGTDPDDPASRLDLFISKDADDLVLTWPNLAMKSQAVDASLTLNEWDPLTGLPASTVNGSRRQQVIPSSMLSGEGSFYRATVGPIDSDGDGVEDWTEAFVLGSSNNSPNSLSEPVMLASGQTLSGDAVALLNHLQGTSPSGTPVAGPPSPVSAARFLMQSTFGPIPEAIKEVREMGFTAWIDHQIALPPSYLTPYIREIKADARGNRIDPTYNYSDLDNFLYGNNVTTPFARNAIGAPDQLRQRVAFALSEILVASRRNADLEEKPEAITNYYDTLIRHSLGNYGDLLLDVALHPTMGLYLSHAGNQKADPSINRYPDENFAREVMQLFTIGLWELNPDGSRKLDLLGEPIPTYDNGGITEMARVFTGLYYSSPYGWGGGGWADDHFTRPMVMHANRHDFEQKQLPGGFVIPAREPSDENGLHDVRDAVDALFQHPNTPPFVSRQLIQFLVTANPSPDYIERIQNVFINDGTGARGNMAAIVKAILLDPEARQLPLSPTFGKVREPVIRTMHLGRLFHLADTHPDFVWWNWTDTYYNDTNQEPMNSPSVFNFFTPVYQAPGEIRNEGLVSPGFQIVDTFSSISVPNLFWRYLHRGFRSSYSWAYPLDQGATLLLADNPAALVDHVNLLVCAGNMTARTRSILLTAVSDPALKQKERVALAVWTALSCPEGAIQH